MPNRVTRRRRRRDRPRLGRFLRWGAVAAAAALFGAALVWLFVIPNPRGLDARDPTTTALMQQRIEESRARGDTLRIAHRWVPLAQVSPNLRRAVVVAEDYRFRQHRGVDWVSLAEEVRWTGGERFSWARPSDWMALARAVGYAWSHRDDVRGRSTITQQLAKNLYFGTDRSFMRKALELVVAGRLERRLTKDRILELYLNLVEWGPGLFGAEAAARHYFGRAAADLTLEEAAALAGTLPHPLTSNPAYRPGQMRWRQEMILQRLRPSPEVREGGVPSVGPGVGPGMGLDGEPPPESPALGNPAPPPGDTAASSRDTTRTGV